MRKSAEWILLCLVIVGCDRNRMTTPATDAPSNPTAEQPASNGTISILAWNVESGGNDPSVIAAQLTELSGYDVYCLCEVSAKNFNRYREAVGDDFTSVEGTLGRADRL